MAQKHSSVLPQISFRKHTSDAEHLVRSDCVCNQQGYTHPAISWRNAVRAVHSHSFCLASMCPIGETQHSSEESPSIKILAKWSPG